MSKKYWTITGILCCASISLAAVGYSYYELLDNDDITRQELDIQNGPALTVAIDEETKQESYNEWKCFSTETLYLDCLQILDAADTFVPSLQILKDSQLYEFSLDADSILNCPQTIKSWRKLLKGEAFFCAYGAYLQKVPEYINPDEGIFDSSLYILEALKTNKGYWDLRNSIQEQKESEQKHDDLDSNF